MKHSVSAIRRGIAKFDSRRTVSQAELLAKKILTTKSVHRALDDVYNQFSRLNGAFFSQGTSQNTRHV